jgi:hypothetical protein
MADFLGFLGANHIGDEHSFVGGRAGSDSVARSPKMIHYGVQ